MELTDLKVGDVFYNPRFCSECWGEVVHTDNDAFKYKMVQCCPKHGRYSPTHVFVVSRPPKISIELADDFLHWVEECRRGIVHHEAGAESIATE